MTFVTVSIHQEQLTLLSQLLVAVFPGCTIHQNRDPVRAMRHFSNQKVDAVFADADTCSNSMDILRRQNSQLCLLCGKDAVLPEATKGFDGILSYPLTEQSVRTTLKSLSRKTGRCDKVMFGDTYG